MSDRRKLGPVRQLSLQTDIRRPNLKKQLSIEHLESIEEHKLPGRAIESAKTNRLSDRPRPIKVAWAENRQQSKDEPPTPKNRFGEAVEVKKCKEHKRPVTAKVRTQISVEKESILSTRQDLAERLRKAWKDKEENKQNLNIFLAQKIEEDDFEDDKNRDEVVLIKNLVKPKIQKQKSLTSEFTYVPSTTSNKPQDVRTNISVTIPIVITPKQDYIVPESPKKVLPEPKKNPDPPKIEETKEQTIQKDPKPKLVKQTSLPIKEEPKTPSPTNTRPSSSVSRPSTATSKRELFQKRTNTAFTGSTTTPNFRPPLTRTLSVPVKSDGSKLKFIATKRRLKSARRKGKEEEEKNSDEDEGKEKKKGGRCKSANGELVTMVSLVSPAGSDEEQETKKEKERKEEEKEVKQEKTPMLKKIVKSVSFQQSTLHSLRSFSASFPSRRVTSALASGSPTSLMAAEREKRAQVESPPGLGESRGPKRRLVRAVSVEQGRDNRRNSSFDDDSSHGSRPKSPDIPEISIQNKQTLGVTHAEILPAPKKQNSIEKSPENSNEDDQEDKENEEFPDDPTIPKFETNKERECWIMYKKMSDKGLPVSFDTILRGMLTPTEYRSVRKEVKTSS